MNVEMKIVTILLLGMLTASVYAQGSTLWGTWEYGGSDYAGSVFSINEKGEEFSIQYSFPSITGEWPKGALCKGASESFYGIANGGLYKGGLIFEFNPIHKEYKVLYQFDKDVGVFPQGGLVFDKNVLYGVTNGGGKNHKGTVYGFDLNSKKLRVLHEFTGKDPYSNIGNKSKLVIYENSLFGLVEMGGKFGKGELFELKLTDTTYHTLVDFNDSIGTYPLASLIVTKSGDLIGTTSKGLNQKDGKIFKYSPKSKTFEILLSFDKVEGNLVQSELTVVNDSILIGLTSYGGKNNAGVLFEYSLSKKTYTEKVHLLKEKTGTISKGQLFKTEDNHIYGLLSEGGANQCGTLFRYGFDTKQFEVIVEFNKLQGYDFENGLTYLNPHQLIGLSKSGGVHTKYGNIFTLDLATKQVHPWLNFQYSPNGKKPIGDLIDYQKYIYGVTQEGGKQDMGTLYRISKATRQFEKLLDFADYQISQVSGSLTLSRDGKMYGSAGNTLSNSLVQIFYYNPETNQIVKLYRFGKDLASQNTLAINEDSSQIIAKSKTGQSVIKYANQPHKVEFSEKEQDTEIVGYVSKNGKTQYPFNKPIGTPILVHQMLYGLFAINEYPKSGGIYSFNLVSKKLHVIEYFKSGTVGNLIHRNGNLLYINSDGIVDSTSIQSVNIFEPNKERPYGHMNIVDETFYYFPYTWDGLFRKSPKDSIAQLVIQFGVAPHTALSRKQIMNDASLSKERDLAKLYIKTEAGELVEKDKYNALITGSVLKGSLLYKDSIFYGTTRAGGLYGSGILFKLDIKTNSFVKLVDFPKRPSAYSDGLPSSLIMVNGMRVLQRVE